MSFSAPDAEANPLVGIDGTVPHSARIWNYWLGGKDNYAVDSAAGDLFLATFPDIAVIARATRAFMGRAVRYLAGEAGIRQFMDIGTGLPSADSTHEIAQLVAPESRIVYVDNDPVVLAHAHALLKSCAEGTTDYVDADLRDPETILGEAGRTLDFSRPVAVMLLGILGHITDDGQARSIVRRLTDAVPAGSYLVVSDGTNVVKGDRGQAAQDDYNDSGAEPYCLRSIERITRFFDRLDLMAPGVVSVSRWRPGTGEVPEEVDAFCGVGQKR
ncbi:MAG: SAM-dependent methyltransferase [Streptosporangiaceae bacterium]